MTRHFCCRLSPSGIGDHISQLQRLYNLGRSFGLEYVFRELPTNRWSPDLNESDFLGLGIGEKRIEDFPDYEIVSVDGAAASYALQDGRPLSSVLPPKMPERAIVEFVHSGKMSSNGIPIPILHKIDLRARLIERHGDQARSSGRSNRLSVCVHIRQGDCTWVKHGDHYVFLGMRKITTNPEDVDIRRAPQVDAYAPLIDAVVARLGGAWYNLKVFSDGPANIFEGRSCAGGTVLYDVARRDQRYLRWMRLDRRINPLQSLYNPMCDADVRRESEHVKTALQRLVARYQNASLVLGTSGALTAAAILAFASADIVVLARNPWVFPLLGLGDQENQAVLLLTSPIAENMKLLEDRLTNRAARPGLSS